MKQKMTQIEKTPRSLGRRAMEARPLPRRWRRVRSWCVDQGLAAPNIAELKVMLKAEALGHG